MDGCACIFISVGLGLHAGNFDDWQHKGQALDPVMAQAEFGYETREGYQFTLAHESQPRIFDTGLNTAWVKKRWNLRLGK